MSSNIKRQAKGAQVAGRNVGGEFAAHERAQATFTPPASDTVDSREAVEARLTEAFTTAAINREDLPDETWEQVDIYLQKHVPDYEKELIYVDRDDQLTPENINDYLSGEQDRYIDMENDILDSYSEGRYLRSEEMARELIEQFVNNDDDLVDEILLNTDIKEDLASVIRDHDTSSPVTQLAQNTPPQLMRKSITKTPFNETEQWVTDQNLSAEDRALLTDPHAPETDEQQARADQLKHEYLLHHLQQAGIDTTKLTPEDHTNLKEMLDNGPYSFTDDGVTLDAIWYGRINDVNIPETEKQRRVTLGGTDYGQSSNPSGHASIVLINTQTGEGADTTISTPIRLTFTNTDPAKLDDEPYGYGWDETAGVYKPAYQVATRDTP